MISLVCKHGLDGLSSSIFNYVWESEVCCGPCHLLPDCDWTWRAERTMYLTFSIHPPYVHTEIERVGQYWFSFDITSWLPANVGQPKSHLEFS